MRQTLSQKTRLDRQLIAKAVANRNGCYQYCLLLPTVAKKQTHEQKISKKHGYQEVQIQMKEEVMKQRKQRKIIK